MKISYNWLKEFVDLKKYPVAKLADLLTMNFAEVDGIEEVGGDDILDLKILPDRAPDCLSHRGVAREIGALAQLKVRAYRQAGKSLKFKVKENRKEKISNILEVENREPELCKRYVARVIKNVKVGSSPKWLSQRLESLGQKSINNVVDATNYVMLELGQPMHIFDLNKIENMQVKSEKSKAKSENPKIVIRKAKNGEKITTLDGKEVELSESILIIADNNNPLAIAGVKGGKKAEVDKNTVNIILESANFSAESVRRASRLTGIKTDSSTRFAADLDPNLAGEAIERLASLIVGLAGLPAQAGGDVAGGKIDIYPRPVKEYKVGFSLEDVNNLLGIELTEKEVLDILKRLDFKTKKVAPRKEVLSLAKKLKGKPYKYGASVSFDAPNAFDCSSLTSYVFAQSGIQIPRMAVDQYFYSYQVDEKEAKPAFAQSYGEAMPGDLVFANTHNLIHKIDKESVEFIKGLKIKEGVDHIGLYLGGGKIIHANNKNGKVVVESLKGAKSFKDFRGFRRVKDIEKENIFVVSIPTHRRDIGSKGTFVLQKADIIEEIGRIYGYQNISSKIPTGSLVLVKESDKFNLEFNVKNIMVSVGFAESYNYSFIGDRDLDAMGIENSAVLSLQNYLSDERKYLRSNLILGLIKNAKDNLKNFNEVRIFELGNVFSKDGNTVKEQKRIGGMIVRGGKLSGKEFYEIKGAVDLLLSKLGISDFWYDDFNPEVSDFNKTLFHLSKTAEIKIGDVSLGVVGEISPRIIDKYQINGRVYVFEIDFDKLAKLAREEVIFRSLPKYPAIVRDIAVLAPLNVRADTVLDVIENAGGLLLDDTDLFDIYEGENISGGLKSMAFHLVFRSSERTLLDKEVDEIVSKIVNALGEKGWEIRQ